MIGNVWEWTSSLYRPYNDAKAITGQYVIRGGAFNAVPSLANAVSRVQYDPATSRNNLAATGFRCAKSLSSGAPPTGR
jgi:formylglycine-generating enzyme required for sulfatase activity